MLRVAFVIIVVSSLFSTSPSISAPFDPKIDEACMINPVPPGTRSAMNPRRFVESLLKTQGLRDSDLNDQSDIGLETRINAIVNFNSFCAQTQHCTEGTPDKLTQAAFSLIEFLERNSRPRPTDQSGFEVSPPVARGALNQTAVDAFLHNSGKYRLACVAAPSRSPPPKPSEAQQKVAKIFSGIAVRSKVSDLAVSNTDKKFDALDSASISFNSDYISKTQTISSSGVVGYQFPKGTFGDYSNFIPYVGYTGKKLNGSGAGKSADISNLSAGLLGDFNIPVGGYYQNFQLSAQTLHSYATETDIVTGTFLYTPDFKFPGVGIAYNPNDGPVAFLIKPQAKFVYGSVSNAGTNASLANTGNYSRGGGRLEL